MFHHESIDCKAEVNITTPFTGIESEPIVTERVDNPVETQDACLQSKNINYYYPSQASEWAKRGRMMVFSYGIGG